MNSETILKCFLIFVFICLANGINMIAKQEKENEICFTVQNSTLNETSEWPLVSLDLLVRYPQSIAEAGFVDLQAELTPGNHKLWYKYRVTNMNHDLEVKLDGKNVDFVKPEIPRWYTVSLFHEVVFAFDENITEYSCSNNKSKEYDHILPFTSGLKIFTSTTKKSLTEDAEIIRKSSFSLVTSSKPENLEIKNESNASTNELPHPRNISEHVNKMVNESFSNREIKETNKLPLTTVSTVVNKSVEKEHASEPPEQETNQINISIGIPNATLDRQENLLPTIFPDLNYSKFENSPPESSQSCPNGNCEGQNSHDYTLALSLVGILCAMVLIAIVISVVFHRKKKKLMISSRARPNNRLRQQIYEKEIAGESQLMLRQMEHTYEELPYFRDRY